MKSFDLFGTLICGRNPAIRDGDQNGHFPIAENIAKVQPSDLIISDYYDADKAQRLLKEIAGLDNALMVSHDGKATGAVWQKLQSCGQVPELHIGDDQITDFASPKTHGVRAELTTLAQLTDLETEMQRRGFTGLAALMREARLRSWQADKTMRQLQLFQTQINLPFLFLASILVHRRMAGRKQLLMSSRDCWLWLQLFSALRERHLPGDYETKYFLTSRLTRYSPSESYIRYCKRIMKLPALAVDLCGFGRSLFALLGSDEVDLLLMVGYDPCFVDCLIPGWLNETTNFARHPMVADVDEVGNPIYANPLNVDWEAIPELAVMHEAFLGAVAAVPHHDFSRDLAFPDHDVNVALRSVFGHFDDYVQALSVLTPFRVAEAQATAELLAARGLTEGVVV